MKKNKIICNLQYAADLLCSRLHLRGRLKLPPPPTSPIRLELTLNTKAVLQVNINLMQQQ